MKILDRYFICQFIMCLFWCLFIFVFFYVMIDFFGRLDEIIEGKVSLKVIAKYYSSLTPLVFVRMCPLAVLLAIMYSLNNLSRNNEITAAVSAGLHPHRLLIPFLFIGVLLSLISMAINELKVPETAQKAYRIKQTQIRKRKEQHLWRDRLFYGSENRKFYVKRLNTKNNTASVIEITQYGKTGLELSKFQAGTAKWTETGWTLYNTTLREFDPAGRVKSTLRANSARVNETGWEFFGGTITKTVSGKEQKESFDKINPEFPGVSEIPQDFTRIQQKPEEMNFAQLREHINRLRKMGFNPQAELISLHTKFAFPFATLVVMMIGIPFAMKQRKGGFLVGFGSALGICLIYYILMSTGRVLGESFMPPVLGAWLPNTILGTVGIFRFSRIPYMSK